MPAAPFLEVQREVQRDDGGLHAVRQHAIERQQCRWIVADEDAGADALMCGAPTAIRHSFCTEHCAQAYIKAEEDEAVEGAQSEPIEQDDSEEEEAE